MDLINYSLTALISFFGLGVGIALAFIAPEEMKDGKKYFIHLQNVLLTLMFFAVLAFDNISIFLISLFSVIFFIFVYYLNRDSSIRYLDYAALGVLFFFSSSNLSLFLLNSALIFLYGMPSGSLQIKVKKRNILEVILKNISFLAIALSLFFLI